MADTLRQELTPQERERLDAGHHGEVAVALTKRGRPDLAGAVLEQIWDWDGAFSAFVAAGRPLDALRIAIESGTALHLDRAIGDIEASGERSIIDRAIALLEKRRRPMEAARLLATRDDPRPRAEALLSAGDRLGAARALAEAGEAKEALDVLTASGELSASGELDLAASLAWDLGDAVAAARYAQRSLRAGSPTEQTRSLLARALGSLGHDLAAQMVLEGHTASSGESGLPGRYRVTGMGPAGLVGAAYVGVDRVTLQEVEIHLLLAEQSESGAVDPEVRAALERFATVAEAASRLGHPAIRPILRLDPDAGLLLLPRAEGPNLRSLIRPPGMVQSPERARALVAFLLEGLQVAHQRGLVHGWLLPSQIGTDAAGRPLLGPFGAHHLAGLAATHTGSLEELMIVTAPELRRGGAPSVASDLYAMGALLLALMGGRLTPPQDELPDLPEVELARALMDPRPEERPGISEVLAMLRRPIADVRDLGRHGAAESRTRMSREQSESAIEIGVVVEAAPDWTDALLGSLCREASAWMQPILDRHERELVLAPWPRGCATLGERGLEKILKRLPQEALAFEDEALHQKIMQSLRASSLVRTPAGDWMLALDDLLTR